MAKTQRLYYTDSYLKQMYAGVTAVSEDGLQVVLDQTVFYPSSGGQPHDLGTLNGIQVVDVQDADEQVVHVLTQPLRGTTAEGAIDWHRRYDHMQQHTGQHLLSAVFERLYGIPTLSFRMADEVSSIELGTKELTPEQVEQVILEASRIARADGAVGITFEQADEVQGLRKVSQREGTLRIIEIPDIDRSACGGTHVARLAEVLPLQMRETDKVRGNVRISFVCGNRAVRQAQRDFETLSRVARLLAVSSEQTEQQVMALQERVAELQKQKQRLENEAASRAGLDLYAETTAGADGVRRRVLAVAVLDEEARHRAKAFASQAKAVLLMHSQEGVLVACSADSGVNAGAALKDALAKAGARGGGSPTLAQGSLGDGAVVSDLIRALGISS